MNRKIIRNGFIVMTTLLIGGCRNQEITVHSSVETLTSVSSSHIFETDTQFTERDLNQNPDLTDAETIIVSDGEDVHINEAGIYIIQGTAQESTVYVNVLDTEKVQLVLDGVTITNTDIPCIYVENADKVFVTTMQDSAFVVTDADAAIVSCDDLVLNGNATLQIDSNAVGVDAKDDLKITGGTYIVNAKTKCFEANDSIRIADGTFTLNAGTDGFHAENNDDDTKGYVYIENGTFVIQAADDGIHGTSVIQIDGGTFKIEAAEGIEATYIQINGGTFEIDASDDGINAGKKSNSYDVKIEITGGDLSINMAQGDTDAIDANGDLIISGGTLTINATSAFDYDGTGTYTGGTLIVNGEQVSELTQSMMGGGFPADGNKNPQTPPSNEEKPSENFQNNPPFDHQNQHK